MDRIHSLGIALLLSAILISACDDNDKCGDCFGGLMQCAGSCECVECCIDNDCYMPDCSTNAVLCNADHECECMYWIEGEDCSRDPEACMDGLACDIFTNTCMTKCNDDAECNARTEIPFSDDLHCKNGICDFNHPPCPGMEYPYWGYCVTIPPCSEIKECVVLPAEAITTSYATAQLSAIPYLHSGAVAPGFNFTWSSDDESVASVADGLVTGGMNPGFATITATVEECPTVTCEAVVTNYGSWIETRVVVVDELDKTPIEGAEVVVGTDAPVITDDHGIAIVSEFGGGNPADVTVSHREYHYATLMAVETIDVMVQLRKIHTLDFSQQPPKLQAGGIKGRFDFGMIRCEPPLKTCNVSIGLAGFSIPGNLINVCSEMIGKKINTEIELGGSKETIPLPEGLVLCLNQTCFKEYYTPTGIPGNRVAWGLGGKLDLADLIDIFAGEGQGKNYGSMISDIVPLFVNFYTAMVPNVEVIPRPMVFDGVDIDGDPLTTEIPDYDNFPPQDMTLRIGMDQAMAIHPPSLPVGVYDGVYIVGGIIVRGAGFVPLGIGAGADSIGDNDIPDGQIDDPIVLSAADVAGRIPQGSFQRVVISLAVKLGSQDTDADPKQWSGQVVFVDSLSGNLFLDDFMLPAQATYDPDGKVLSVVGLPVGSDYSQAVFSGTDGASWNILGEWITGDYVLPADPDPQNPRSSRASFISIDLQDGIDYQDLLEFNSTNMGDLAYLVKAFSYTEVGGT